MVLLVGGLIAVVVEAVADFGPGGLAGLALALALASALALATLLVLVVLVVWTDCREGKRSVCEWPVMRVGDPPIAAIASEADDKRGPYLVVLLTAVVPLTSVAALAAVGRTCRVTALTAAAGLAVFVLAPLLRA